MNRNKKAYLTLLMFASLGLSLVSAQTPPTTSVATQPAKSTSLDITDLKIEMAESGLAVSRSLPKIADLSNALEAYLNRNCFGDLLRTLTYEGPPTDPTCIARMERLFEIYPKSPVALCLRDGVSAKTCKDAYQEQTFEKFSDRLASSGLLDPTLKIGLSTRDKTKVKALQETLENVNKDYQGAKTDEDKQQNLDDALQLYDQLLSITCKLSTTHLEESIAEKVRRYEDPAVKDVRTKLLHVPPALRAEYQKKMLEEAEIELSKSKGDKYRTAIILEKIQAIQNPQEDKLLTAAGALRKRVVLPECYEMVERAGSIIPQFPSPTCHRIGWNSPQCLEALQGWRNYRIQVHKAAHERGLRNATPTPNNVISSF